MAAAMRRMWGRVRALPWPRFVAGVVAGFGALLLTLVLRLFGLGTFLPYVAVDFAVGLVPGSVESAFIRAMGGGAKVLALVVAVVLILGTYGVAAVFYRRVERLLKNRWLVMAAYTIGTAAVSLLVVLPLLGGGVAGANTSVGAGFSTFSQLLAGWIYAAVLDYFLVDVAARHPEGFNPTRRDLLKWGVATAIVAVGALYGLSRLIPQVGRLVFGSVAEMYAKEVTPTEEFYTVTKNAMDPSNIDLASWRLIVDGLVASPASFTFDQLRAMVPVEEYATLECVSNEVGGNLISTAKWSGIPLWSFLTALGPDAAADWVLFTCLDGYTVAIPVSKAQDGAVLLALLMNDDLLPEKHGKPARILVPGRYGMFSAKWLNRITLVQGEVLGFWQQKGWTNRGDIRPTAIIATPPADAVVQGPVTIGGVAFSGERGISDVQVSTDGGANWGSASRKAPLTGPRTDLPAGLTLTWVLWTYDWTPPAGGSYRIVARMVDASGVPQEPARNPPYSDGASGYDGITLLVSG